MTNRDHMSPPGNGPGTPTAVAYDGNQSPITLKSTTDGISWKIVRVGTGTENLSGVFYVRDSDASGGKTMSTLTFGSLDLGGNNNWLFLSGVKIQQYFNIFDARNLLDP
jgi:hypothetical protein